MGVIKLIMNEIMFVDHLINLDSAYSDKKWWESNASRNPHVDVMFQNFLQTTISHVRDLGCPNEILDYFDTHYTEYPNLVRRDVESVFN